MSQRDSSPEELALSHAGSGEGRILFIAGEDFSASQLSRLSGHADIMTNRWDLYNVLERGNINPGGSLGRSSGKVVFIDWEIKEPYKVIYLRVLKDKAANHHIINTAAQVLEPGGQLVLTGNRGEGIKTYISRAADRLGGKVSTSIAGQGNRLGAVDMGTPGKPLDDKNYAKLRKNIIPGLPGIYSKPGIFGWQKEDKGSRFLMEKVPSLQDRRVLDLGCGYGYLSVKAWESGASYVVGTDNNAAALAAWEKNLNYLEAAGEFRAGDCGSTVEGKFNIILCNPPFHSGFGESREITERFMKSIKEHLTPGGTAYAVLNRFVGVEKILMSLELSFDQMAESNQFKILKITL